MSLRLRSDESDPEIPGIIQQTHQGRRSYARRGAGGEPCGFAALAALLLALIGNCTAAQVIECDLLSARLGWQGTLAINHSQMVGECRLMDLALLRQRMNQPQRDGFLQHAICLVHALRPHDS